VFRNIPINERAFAQLRFEGYNVFNTVTYNAPVSEFTRVNFDVCWDRRLRGIYRSARGFTFSGIDPTETTLPSSKISFPKIDCSNS